MKARGLNFKNIDDIVLRAYAMEGAIQHKFITVEDINDLYTDEECLGEDADWILWRTSTLYESLNALKE